MQQLLQVGTRKGLFTVRRMPTGWRLGQPAFPGEPVTQVVADPRTGEWYAALRLGHFGVKIKRSTNQGASWQLVTSLWDRPDRKDWFGGGYDYAGIHSILVDPRDAAHVTLAISCAGVWQTRDHGMTWTNTSEGMDAGAYMPPERRYDGNVQDVHRIAACGAQPDVLWAQNHVGIYRSVDGGLHWQAIPSPAPSGFGFPVVAHAVDPQCAWFAPAHSDAQRVPVDGRLVVNVTRDGGASFRTHGDGLPARDAYHLVYRHGLAVAADGQTLAMGSTTGGLWVSEDGGESWECLSRDLPPIAVVRFA